MRRRPASAAGAADARRDGRERRRLAKAILLSILVVGALGSVTVPRVWALLAGEEGNAGAQVASGTFTMENLNASGSASTTLSDKVGVTTLSGTVSSSAGTITVDATTYATFPSTNGFTVRIDNENMTVTGGAGTNTWTVSRGANNTNPASHSSGATVVQKTISVAGFSGFPTASRYTVLVGSERMMVTAGQGTTTWTVTRGVDGTIAAAHSSGATVATSTCKSLSGSSNVNTACDSVFTFAPDTEMYPGDSTTSRVTITNTGSIDSGDLELWMPYCLRGIAADSPLASTTPTISSFSAASASGGHLAGGTTYYYEVTAVIGGVETVAGAEAAYTPSSGSTNQITLNWSAIAGASSYKVYRSDNAVGDAGEGGEALLASGITGTSYADTSNTAPSGSPPSGTGSGNPCSGVEEFYVQEVNSGGSVVQCYYPPAMGTTCSFSGTYTLGIFTGLDQLGNTLALGTGPSATSSRYFKIGVALPSNADNTMQGTEALFTLHWYMQAAHS